MARTVIGLFDSARDAEYVIRMLTDQGFSASDISVITNDTHDAHGSERSVGQHTADPGNVTAGAAGGGVLGGALGLLVGAGLLTIPGIGPVLAAGPIAAALGSTALGAAAGGMVGGLVGAGIPHDEASSYAEGVRRGGTLISVSAPETMAPQVAELMRRQGAVDIQQRSTTWASEGWTGFDPAGAPYDRQVSTDPRTRTEQSDYARGQRDLPPAPRGPDYARGQHDEE